MAIIYPDNPERPSFFINPHKIDPIKQYIKHYDNWKFLNFVCNNTKDWQERRQANGEITTVQKKMDYWYKMIKDAGRLGELESAKKPIDTKWKGE